MRLAKMVQKDTILEARRFSTLADGRISDVQGVAVPIQKGGMCVVDIMGVHMNREWGGSLPTIRGLFLSAIHWGDDVDEFKPERFMDTDTHKWPRDACTCSFIVSYELLKFDLLSCLWCVCVCVCVLVFAFSAGPRACIGQRFAMAESICILASVVRRYEILLPTDVLGLSVNEQEEILAGWKVLATLIPTGARVRFRRR